MKMTMEFDLPAEEYDFHNALRANRMHSAIDEVLERKIRPVLKHGEPSEETRNILEEIRTELRESLTVVES